MKVSKKKIRILLITITLIVIQWVVYFIFLKDNLNYSRSLVEVSFISVIIFVIEILCWKKLTNELLCPFIIFFMVLFLFCCGQSIGWSTGMDMGVKDMWNRVDHGINHQLLLRGLCYSSLGISFFYLGAVIICKANGIHVKQSKYDSVEIENTYKNLGKILLFICIPAFLAKTYSGVMVAMQGGYGAIYDFKVSSSIFMRICSLLGNYYQPCLLLLLIAYRKNNRYRKWIVLGMLLDVIVNLYIGGRSGAVMTVLAIFLSYHYFIKPFNKRQLLMGTIGGYFGIALLNVVADTRGSSGRGVLIMFTEIGNALSNVIGEFIGELGWSITSVCWTMNLVPNNYAFRNGMTYLVSLIAWVPSFFFSGDHPVTMWGELSQWLQTALHMSYGPGYTMVAEAYLNFGNYGFLAMFIEGMIVTYFIARVSRVNTEKNLLTSTFQIMVIMVIMKSLVRSSVSMVIRQVVLVILPIYLLVIFSLKQSRSRKV